MSPHRAPHRQDVTLQLPGGEQYRLKVDADELAGWLAPQRHPPHEPDAAAIQVEVRHAGGRAVVRTGAAELARWLSRARPAAEAEPSMRPDADPDPARGRGTRDPAAHRLGPNTDQRPDSMHRGRRRYRRQP
jgi:hypothetical protein